jgi:prepilin-type N-terminal cleavage/methylation domain-containing protein
VQRYAGRNAYRRIQAPIVGTSASGFSLVELLVAMAIVLIIAAFAIPTLTTTMDAYRLRGTMGSVAQMAEKCRIQAVKRNTTQQLHVFVNGGNVVLYYKDANSTTPALQNTDPQFPLANLFSVPGTPTGGPTLLTGNAMWGSNVVPNVDVDPFFNSRGLPCLINGGGPCSPTSGFVYYFRYQSSGTRWAALSVSPAGRIQNWFWNGSGWGN